MNKFINLFVIYYFILSTIVTDGAVTDGPSDLPIRYCVSCYEYETNMMQE